MEAYKPLRSAPRMSIMISAIGVSYLLQNLALYIKSLQVIDGALTQIRIPEISESTLLPGLPHQEKHIQDIVKSDLKLRLYLLCIID